MPSALATTLFHTHPPKHTCCRITSHSHKLLRKPVYLSLATSRKHIFAFEAPQIKPTTDPPLRLSQPQAQAHNCPVRGQQLYGNCLSSLPYLSLQRFPPRALYKEFHKGLLRLLRQTRLLQKRAAFPFVIISPSHPAECSTSLTRALSTETVLEQQATLAIP